MSSLSLNEMAYPSMERKPSRDDSDNNMDYVDMIRPQERPNFESSENWSNFGMLSNSFSRNRSVSQLESSQGLPPWLLSPDGTKQSVSWLPTGFNPDASLPNLDIDAPTAVTVDENDVVDDDDSRRELRGGQKMEKSEDGAVVGDDLLLERLKKLGISEYITAKGEDDIPDDLSDLSNGNASYIMDLAHQKENREKLLKEECLESALALYKRASGDGHAGQEVFLTILSHVQKRKRISKQKFYKLQDQRLEEALQDELKLRDSQDAEDDNSITIGDELESIAESSKQENQESEWHESEYDWGEVGGNSSGDLGPSNDIDKKKRSSKKKKRTSSKSRDSKTRPSKSKSDMTSDRRKGDWRSLSVGSLSTSDHGNSSDHGDTKFQFLRRSLNDLEAVQEEPTPEKPKKKTSKKDKKTSSTEDPLKKSKSKKTSKKKKSNSMTPSERTVESTAASSGLSEDMEISESPPLLKREVFVVEAAKASPTKTKKKKSVKSSTSSEEVEVTKSPREETADDSDAVMKSPKTSKRKKSVNKKATKSDSLTMKSPTSPKKKRVTSKKARSEPSLMSPPPESPKKKKSTKKSSTKSDKSGELTQESDSKPLSSAPESPSKPTSSTTAATSTSASSKKATSKKPASLTGIVTSIFGHKKASKESGTDDKKRRGLLSRFKSRSSDNVLDPKDRLLPIPGSQLQSIAT